MHLRHLLILLLIASGVLFAQDTNFPVGPQYLVTTSSTLFLRPIATPALSLGEMPSANAATGEAELAQEAPVPSAVTNQTFLSDVYWGDHPASEIEARRIETPSLAASQTAEIANAIATGTQFAAPGSVLPGIPAQSSESSGLIEITSEALARALPASFFDPGVTGVLDSSSVLERGFGFTLGEIAAYWKSHKLKAPRVFTNRDVERLHGD